MAYFLDPSRVCIPAYINLFMALLDMPAAEPLRTQLAASQDKLLVLLAAPQQQQQGEAAAAGGQQEGGGAAPMAVDAPAAAANTGARVWPLGFEVMLCL